MGRQFLARQRCMQARGSAGSIGATIGDAGRRDHNLAFHEVRERRVRCAKHEPAVGGK